jgi:hypothetical protein
VPLSQGAVFFGLVLLYVALLPLGTVLLRLLEYLRGRQLELSTLERVLVAPYLAVGLLFAIASISVPIYSAGLVAGLLIAGVVALAILWIRNGLESVRSSFVTPHARVSYLIWIGTGALLLLEVTSTGTHPFPNAYDGSFQSLYVKLILAQHTIPWTLAPYGQIGIIYPQGTAVWFTLPVLLLGWPIQSSPVTLPLLFLSLAVPASYCMGVRLAGPPASRAVMTGLLFAGFFGLVASWPRLFVGGSYDFAIGLPLFLLSAAWIRPLVEPPLRPWRDVLLFGGLLGVLTLFSVALGEFLFLLLIASLLAFRSNARNLVRAWMTRIPAILGVGVAFVSRSIAGIIIWFNYPGHVLNSLGNPPYATQPGLPSPSAETYSGDLNPFIPLKPKLSPIPILSVEMTVLLAGGLAICAFWYLGYKNRLKAFLSENLVSQVVLGTAVAFLWTLALVASSGTSLGTSILDYLASLYESSFLFFIFLQLVALLPLLTLAELLRSGHNRIPDPAPEATNDARRYRRSQDSCRRLRPLSRSGTFAIALLLASPFAIGAIVTAAQVPSYLSGHLDQFSNVTSSDVTALTWAGAHLPSCSRVLVAPGSAAQFLPLYADAQLLFPMMPLPLNLSYYVAIGNLTDGIYSNVTRAALVSLTVTEVFVTGQTSVSYLPLRIAPMASSSDFSNLFASGDAAIFAFLLGTVSSNCPP